MVFRVRTFCTLTRRAAADGPAGFQPTGRSCTSRCHAAAAARPARCRKAAGSGGFRSRPPPVWFRACRGVNFLVPLEEFHAEHAPAIERSLFTARGDYLQVGPVHRRAQEGLGTAHAHAALLVHFELRAAGVVAAIEVLTWRCGSSAASRKASRISRTALPLDAPLVACACGRAAVRAILRAVEVVRAAPVVLGLLEYGQDAVQDQPWSPVCAPFVVVRCWPRR